MSELEKLRLLTDNEDISGAELELALSEAEGFILAHTRRNIDEWLPVFDGIKLSVSAALLNRRGAEGVSVRKEGEVSTSFEGILPYVSVLNTYRLIRGADK